MKATHLTSFGLENLSHVDVATPEPGAGEILVRLKAASINSRDLQIATGGFTPNVEFPLVPLSDGAGEVVAISADVTKWKVGDRVCPLFFPAWQSGEALTDERKVSSGLETDGVLREYGVYGENAVAAYASHLSPAEAACYPCAGLTAWTSLVEKSNISVGDWVLIQGTGGVALMGLQLAKALGANVILISSSDEKLARARELGADHCINYKTTPDWGTGAFEIAGHGVDAVLEVGGSGTLENSLNAIRHGGHINIIGYMAGIDMGITVFPLIIKNANLHGIGVGHRAGFKEMMQLVENKKIRPVISKNYAFEQANSALADIARAEHFGKLVVAID